MREYIITHFIHPLEKPIQLSKKLDISLDNLRSEEEQKRLKEFIKISMDSNDEVYNRPGQKMRLPKVAPDGIVSVEWGLRNFAEINKHDKYITNFLSTNTVDDHWDILSKMWIVLRVGNNSEIYNNVPDSEFSSFFYLDDENPVIENAVNYTYILSLLANKIQERLGMTFVLPDLSYLIDFPEPDTLFNSIILFFCANNVTYNTKFESDKMYDFNYIRKSLEDKANQIEMMLNKDSAKKLLYIGNLLKASDIRYIDSRLKFNTLVSIIELILTHNPDNSRFNVEDSISKQFRLKTSILAYMEDPNIDLEEIKRNLKEIYNQRSNIAHGNFNEFYKYLAKGPSKDVSFPTEHFYDLIDKLYNYVKICINQYVTKKEFVDFLKNN